VPPFVFNAENEPVSLLHPVSAQTVPDGHEPTGDLVFVEITDASIIWPAKVANLGLEPDIARKQRCALCCPDRCTHFSRRGNRVGHPPV